MTLVMISRAGLRNGRSVGPFGAALAFSLGSLACLSTAQAQGAVAQSAAAQSTAIAQSETIGSREVLLGTSTIPRNVTVAALERDAQAYYDAAERERLLGRADSSQRQLELLVARYPQTAIANVARHDLGPKSYLGGTPPADVPFSLGRTDATPNGWQATTTTGTTAGAPAGATDPSKRPARPSPTRNAQDTLRQSAGDLVFFSDGSAELGTRARRVLEAQADWLKSQPTVRITVEGHADDSGSTAENMQLSEARAKAVSNRLVELGIEAARLSTSAVGKTKRVADCDDSACAAQNRRVATVINAQAVTQTGTPPNNVAQTRPQSASKASETVDRLPWAPATTSVR
jgi:outer membrane protein OmpA-like peptidoglycan-associated protein